jgi:AraC-like DNA-binding protein
MLFANIELMPAPLVHLIGHSTFPAPLPAAIVMIPISIFVIAAVTRDLLVTQRIHTLTWRLAILRMVSGFLEAGLIGSSTAWHQFVRLMQQVGMRPKLFTRIARFEAALDGKARFVANSWTDVAHQFGYYDQMHMVHDFGGFTGETPTKTRDI